MKLIWTDFATSSLFEIYKYYKETTSENVAKSLKSKIFTALRQLSKHPFIGQTEINLQTLGEDHRYIISGNNKIIYKIELDMGTG